MKIKRKRGAFQIWLRDIKLLGWFEREIITTRKGEALPDQPKINMPDANRAMLESLRHRPWLNEDRAFSFIPLVIMVKSGEFSWFAVICAFALIVLGLILDLISKKSSKAQPSPKKVSNNTLQTLARMEQEESAKRIPQPQAKTTYDHVNRVIDWADPNKQDRIPIEELKDKKSINYYQNFSYNFLKEQQKLWDRGSWASQQFLNFYNPWTGHKGWGNDSFCPHREEISKLDVFELKIWKEPASITTPI